VNCARSSQAYVFSACSLEASTPPLFETEAEERLVLDYQKSEKARFGAPEHIQRYNALAAGNTMLMQRSGRKRLFDHNVFSARRLRGKDTAGGRAAARGKNSSAPIL
jgi:hypothetical protein